MTVPLVRIDTSLSRRIRIGRGEDDELRNPETFPWDDVPIETVRAFATRIAMDADEEDGGARCIFCKHAVFYFPFREAICVGHVYSRAGLEDVRIVGCCEYCFDDCTTEDEED